MGKPSRWSWSVGRWGRPWPGNAPSWARSVGVWLVAINMLVQLAWLPAYPIWSIMAIVLDVFVLYALVATWGRRTDW